MQLRHLIRFGDGRQVHHLVLPDHRFAKIAEGLLLLLRQGQSQLREPCFQRIVHHAHLQYPLALTMPLRSTWVSS